MRVVAVDAADVAIEQVELQHCYNWLELELNWSIKY